MKTSQLMYLSAVVISAPFITLEFASFAGPIAILLGFIAAWREG
ncbi:hypothetical protein [Paraburkholderia sp. Tr-20389]|nr:hypothetical protein [Paraburkholderia sp. Tr-20389]